jgi:hypothetical protein
MRPHAGGKTPQYRRTGIISVANPNLARQRGAAVECFGAMFVGYFEM